MSANEPTLQPLTGWQLWAAALFLSMANLIAILDMTIANVSVLTIAGGLAVTPTQGTWVITSLAVANAIAVPLAVTGQVTPLEPHAGQVVPGRRAVMALCDPGIGGLGFGQLARRIERVAQT